MSPTQTRQEVVLERLEIAVNELQSVVAEFHAVMGEHDQPHVEGEDKDDDTR